MEYEDLIDVVTPEGVRLELRLAGLGSRAIALILDWLLRIAAWLLILLVLVLAGAGDDARAIVLVLATFAALLVYDICFEAWGGGRTPGKRWTSLRVVHADGRPIGFGAAALRTVVRLVDGPPSVYLIGVVSIIATKRNQRLGDLAASTIVVREPRAGKPSEPAPQTDVTRPPGVLPAWDVAAIDQRELVTVRQFLARREMLAADARIDLAHQLADGLAAKIPGVAPPVDPERFLQTLVAIKASR